MKEVVDWRRIYEEILKEKVDWKKALEKGMHRNREIDSEFA